MVKLLLRQSIWVCWVIDLAEKRIDRFESVIIIGISSDVLYLITLTEKAHRSTTIHTARIPPDILPANVVWIIGSYNRVVVNIKN